MDELQDSGWIIGLPDGWVCAHTAVVRYCEKLADCSGEDLRDARVVAAFQLALLSGELSASIFNGHDFKALPKAAFLKPHVIDAGLRNGSIELDPLWPDEWRPWNGHGWAFPKGHFESWLSSEAAFRVADLPPAPSVPIGETVEPLQVREPSRRKRISLSEGVSWIAFGLALDAERLMDAIRWDRLAGGDLQSAQRKIAEAIETLLDAGADEKIAFHGRHEKGPNAGAVKTDKIEAHLLDDYRQFLIGADILHGGRGLKRWYSKHDQYRNNASELADTFTHVTVDRANLMSHFPAKVDNMQALLEALPASLPDIGPVMGLAEAIHWKAHGRPSYDTKVWQSADGALLFTDPDGNEIGTNTVGQQPPHMVAFLGASRDCWAALQEGLVTGIIAPADSPPLHVPRLYWNKVAPEYLDLIYVGMTPGEAGIGCPILVSRAQFDDWRSSQVSNAEPAEGKPLSVGGVGKSPRAPAVKAGRPPTDADILAKADEMKLRLKDGRLIAKTMRFEPGFENVATTEVRALIKGRWEGGRPKKKTAG